MKIYASDMRAAGRADLSGRWGESAMLTFVYVILVTIFNGAVGNAFDLWYMGMGSLMTVLMFPMAWGFGMTFLENHRHTDGDPFDLGHLFDGYRDFTRIFLTLFLLMIIVGIGLVLFIVPGIYFALAFAMAPYLMRDEPELKYQAALLKSKDMMVGHKWELFCLLLSFIGWLILALLTLGIGFFWLIPYANAAVVNFYEEVKRDYEEGRVYEHISTESPAEEPKSEYERSRGEYNK